MSDLPRMVIACYRPKPGREEELDRLMQTHLKVLRSEDLVTDRASIMMKSEDGTVVEVFEWKSRAAVGRAHENLRAQEMWGEFAKVCDYVPISTVPEAAGEFSDFAPFNLE